MRKKVRIVDNAELNTAEAAKPEVAEAPVAKSELQEMGTAMAQEAKAVAETSEEKNGEQEGQRRNRRSPRHLRASGQRRRRIRDTRPEKGEDMEAMVTDAVGHAVEEVTDTLNDIENVVSIVEKRKPSVRLKSGVASPEMAMGKVWPAAGKPAVAAIEAPAEAEAPATTAAPTAEVADKTAPALGGVAMPELAMGKAFPLRAEVAAQPVTETVVEETVVEEVVAQEPAVEAPEVAETAEETVVEAPKAEAETDVAAAIAAAQAAMLGMHAQQPVEEAPVAEEPAVVESPEPTATVEEAKAPEASVAEVETAAAQVCATSPRGQHATAKMAKAPAPAEAAEAEVVAIAPLRETRFAARQAGSQTATSHAASGARSTMPTAE